MERLLQAFEPYRHVDPAGWVGVYRNAPVPAGIVAALLGVLLLVRGRGLLFRLVAGPLGALIGAAWTAPVLTRFGVTGNHAVLTSGATTALAVLGLAWPPPIVFLAFGLPTGLLAGQLAGPNDWLLGFGPGFLLGGAVGVVFQTVVAAGLAAAVGAWLVMEGLMAALAPSVGLVTWLANNPVPTLSLMACLALVGGVYQGFVRPPPEEEAKRKTEAALRKKHQAEQAAMEKRWSSYKKNDKSF